ncbi:MAG: glycosyltransferase [Verrucomicrobiota bacterium]
MSIPRIIHQAWNTNDVPEQFHAWQQKVKDLHPNWEYRLWTDDDSRELIKDKYPQDLERFDALPRNIMRSDMTRYFVMDSIGGFYLDLDYEVYQSFEPVAAKYDFVLPKNREPGDTSKIKQWQVGNAIFGSSPGHPFWQNVFADFRNGPREIRTPEGNIHVEEITGPAFLTRIIHEQPLEPSDGDWIAPRKHFHPRHDEFEAGDPDVFGFHHCSGSWRPKPTILQRAKNRLKRMFQGENTAEK